MSAYSLISGIAAGDIDTSAKLRTIVTDETGTGVLAFATSPTLTTPVVSGTLTINNNGAAIIVQGQTAGQSAYFDMRRPSSTVRALFGVDGSGLAQAADQFTIATWTNHPIAFWTNQIKRWTMEAAGHFLAATDNSFDIGASGATRPRSGYFGTLLRSPKFETADAVNWTSGAGSPEGAVTAAVGALYTRTDGGAGTTLYVKESGGAGNTGWVGK